MMKYKILIALTILTALVSCAKWNKTEAVDTDTSRPWERDPQLWEEYKAELRAYKQRKHKLVYVRFDNAAENPGSEKNFMRCLPDSLDYVSLTNAENFSAYDAEDMEWMHSVGTKVLYRLDLSREPDLAKATATVKDNGLTGYSITGVSKANTDKAAEALSKLSGQGMIAFEGNPTLLAQEDIDKIDLFILSSETVENGYTLGNMISDAVEHGISRDKILLAVSMNGSWYDSSNTEQPVVPSMADNVTVYGPLAGLAVYDIMSDYYHYEGNWMTIRSTISRLNP